MREEISAAVLFLARLIEKGENCNRDQLEHFKLRLSEILLEKFENHWFPDKPDKGQGYRCIRVNGVSRRDASLEKAALASGIKYEDIKLPCELTIWVDPNEVCCRFGENKGSFCTLASFSDKEGSENSSGSEDSQCEEPIKMDLNQMQRKEPGQVERMNVNWRNSWRGRKVGNGNGKQKGGGGGGGGGGGMKRGLGPGIHHHHINPWYNLIAPPWLPPSPPPYHPILRNHPPKWSPPTRYHWPPKSTLKV